MNGKKLLGMSIMAVLIAAQLFVAPQIVNAQESEKVTNTCTNVDSIQAELLYNFICDNIRGNYEGIYDFRNIKMTISNQRQEEAFVVVDVDVTAEMTLIKSPKESQYVKGMEAAIENFADQDDVALATQRYNEYLEQVMPCYNETIPIGFEYQVNIPNSIRTRGSNDENFVIYHKIETEEGALLTQIEAGEKYDEQGNYQAGSEDITRYVQSSKGNARIARSITYSRAQAIAYAVEHATETPEYSEANGMGSDCANFVSKCINAGGIPEDIPGDWYRATSAGTYGGINWIRTGYNNNGGVVPYMTSKGYFEAVSYSWQTTLGSIMYWNTKSHVAMVTRIDGYNIYYSHHSDTAKASPYYLYHSSDDVTFYIPQI